jgi:hypothetical protein
MVHGMNGGGYVGVRNEDGDEATALSTYMNRQEGKIEEIK